MVEAQQVYSVTPITPISYEAQAAMQVQPLLQVQSFAAVMGVIMTVWAATFVLSQIIKVFKGKEVEKPPLLGSSNNPNKNGQEWEKKHSMRLKALERGIVI